MLRNCRICDKQFDYCPSCAITKSIFKQKGMCSNDCYEISNIIQRYRCHLITADEAALALDMYNIDSKQLQPKIAKYYEEILDNATKLEEVVPEENVEVVILNDEDTTTSDDE